MKTIINIVAIDINEKNYYQNSLADKIIDN